MVTGTTQASGMCYTAVDQANALFFFSQNPLINVIRSNLPHVAKTGIDSLNTKLCHDYVSSPTYCVNVVMRELDYASTIQNIMLVCYVKDVMLTGLSEPNTKYLIYFMMHIPARD